MALMVLVEKLPKLNFPASMPLGLIFGLGLLPLKNRDFIAQCLDLFRLVLDNLQEPNNQRSKLRFINCWQLGYFSVQFIIHKN